MTKIESKKVTVPAEIPVVTEFLSNTDNLIHLLPQDRISDWKSDGKVCSFKIQGAYTIGIEYLDSDPGGIIRYKSTAGSPFPFTLNAHLSAAGNATEARQVCEAQLNPFLVMIVKEPLRNLFDYMADKLASRFSG
jgi:hypothetical protein